MGIAKIRHLRSKIRRMGASCTNIIGMRLKNRERADLARSEVIEAMPHKSPHSGWVEDAVAQVSVLAQNLSTIPPE